MDGPQVSDGQDQNPQTAGEVLGAQSHDTHHAPATGPNSTSALPASAPPPQVGNQSNPGASHWHVRFRKDIRLLQTNHARHVKALSVKAKVKVTTVRRYVDRTFKHHKKNNLWNAFRAWSKHNPSAAGAPTAGQSQLQAYRALTSAHRLAIKTWQMQYVEDAPVKSAQKEFNAACRDMVNRLRHLQLRFGITVAAVMSHADDGITPFLAMSTQSSSALGTAVNRIKAGKTADDLATMFDRAVKIKIWEQPNSSQAMDDAITDPTPALSPPQQLSKDLIAYIHALVGPALENKSEEHRGKWTKATGNGTRLRYKDFFSLLAEIGFFVEGWPTESMRLVGIDAMTNLPQTPPLPTSTTIWSGSIRNTSVWTDAPMQALREALRDGTLRVIEANIDNDTVA
ncbi:hypothetical protein CF319_g2266 [Tilletia indica]|nr:hypothetical protein CF319_g2266 [Tilletia indica]